MLWYGTTEAVDDWLEKVLGGKPNKHDDDVFYIDEDEIEN